MFSPSVVGRRLRPLMIALLLVAGLGFSQGAPVATTQLAAATPVVVAEKPDRPRNAVSARKVAIEFMDARFAGATPQQLSKFFSKNADWYMQGDEAAAPWLGRKVGRAEFVEHFTQLEELTRAEDFQMDQIVADRDRAIVLGTFRVTILATGKTFDSEYAFDIKVGRNGKITRYHALEDSLALSKASRPLRK
jgi:ketosteroid isomerase-like protein